MNLYDFEQRKQPRKSGISKAKETEFHTKLDQLVHNTFGKRKGEMEESTNTLNIGDPVIISGKGINFEGATGEVAEVGREGKFLVVNLYNHGKHSFHSSDVSYNDYADSDDEEARMYDAGEFRDEDLTEFATAGGDDGDRDPEEILFQLAKQWWLGTEQEMIRAERTLASMGWEIGEDEGYDDGGVFVVRAGDENGKSYISWAHDDLQGVDEARANTAGARAGLARRANAVPLSPEEQAAKDKAKADKWLEKERAKMAAKKGVAEGFSDMMAKERKKRLAAAEKKKQERRANTGDPAPQHYRDELAQAAKKYKKGVAEGFKNSYSVGDRVDSPLGTGTIVALSKNIDIDDKVKVKLDDPSKAGEDGKHKDAFVLTTSMLKHLPEQGVAEAGNKPLEKSRFGTGDTRTPRDIKSQMSGASDEFVKSTADKNTGPFHSKVAKMQGKMAKSELRRREQGMAEDSLDEVSRGDYYKKATMGKAMAQMSAGFARSPEEREKFNQIAGRRERGLARSKARTDKFWADKAAKDEADRLEQLRAKYAGVDIDAEIAKLKPAIDSAYHEYQYGARNTYSQGRDDYNSLMGRVQELERAKKALAGLEEHIGKVKDGYRLYSHTGKNLGTYPTHAGAEKREKQVNYFKHANEDTEELSELSNELLGQYKKAAGISARDLDKAGKYKQADKRFHGIVQATKKELDNDMKKHQQDEVLESRLASMKRAGYDIE